MTKPSNPNLATPTAVTEKQVSKSLAALHVIVTRPAAQAHLWQNQLQDLGAEVSLLSVLDIVAVQDERERQAIKNRILALDHYRKVIFVSQNAVREAWQWIDQYWPQFPIGVEVFAIGASTAKLLESFFGPHGITVSTADSAMNSEELLDLPALQQVAGEKILLCRGCGGRPTLMEELQQRGASVDLCELYHRELPKAAYPALKNLLPNILSSVPLANQNLRDRSSNSAKICVLSAHSGESLENLMQVIQASISDDATLAALQDTPLLVPGSRVSELATNMGFKHIITAVNATDAAMTAAIADWLERRNGHLDAQER